MMYLNNHELNYHEEEYVNMINNNIFNGALRWVILTWFVVRKIWFHCICIQNDVQLNSSKNTKIHNYLLIVFEDTIYTHIWCVWRENEMHIYPHISLKLS